jgi:hypothetical protein
VVAHIPIFCILGAKCSSNLSTERNCLGKGLVNPPPSAQCNWVIAFGFTMHSLTQYTSQSKRELQDIFCAVLCRSARESGWRRRQTSHPIWELVASFGREKKKSGPVSWSMLLCWCSRSVITNYTGLLWLGWRYSISSAQITLCVLFDAPLSFRTHHSDMGNCSLLAKSFSTLSRAAYMHSSKFKFPRPAD